MKFKPVSNFCKRLVNPVVNLGLTLAIGLTVAFSASVFTAREAKAECVRSVPPGDVLWIRSGPGSRFSRIGSFGRHECNVRIFWGSCRGSWCRVAKGGRSGWAHTRYLGARVPGGGGGGLCAKSCQQLWVSRNAIYKNNGYCFRTRRARRHFGNAGCYIHNQGAVPLSRWERRRIRNIRRCERRKGC